jgi:hypothetical protein
MTALCPHCHRPAPTHPGFCGQLVFAHHKHGDKPCLGWGKPAPRVEYPADLLAAQRAAFCLRLHKIEPEELHRIVEAIREAENANA